MADAIPTPATPAVGKKPSSVWLIIFTDLVALLLTFFVMLFSMSNVQIDRWKEMIDALSQTLNPAKETVKLIPASEYNISSIFRRRAINLDYLLAVFEAKVIRHEALKGSKLTLLEDRLVISLPGEILFSTGSAVLQDQAKGALFTLGGLLRNVENQLAVNGFSAETDFAAQEYTSNWELSLARSIAIGNAFRRAGYTEEILNFGYGDSRAPFLANATDEQRKTLSKRIDIVIMAAGSAI
ncbi:MAG: OmpA family protein [Rhodospirillaceae bacterium]|nr:OmpA family protein [Rhodospirillaceae bacterium]